MITKVPLIIITIMPIADSENYKTQYFGLRSSVKLRLSVNYRSIAD
jgi:hypothetical protein